MGKKDKSGKFQMKISGFFSPPQSKKATSPDSGFNSRSETPAVEAESKEEKEEQNDTEEEVLDESATEEAEMADEKKKFLEDLEESDVEKEKPEKEETDEEEEEESSSSEEESDDEFDPNDSDDDVKMKGFMAKKAPPKRKAPAGRGRGGAQKMPTALTGELSEYEKIRQGNIAEREAMLQALMADFDSFKKDSGIGAAKKAPPKKRKRVDYDSDDEGG